MSESATTVTSAPMSGHRVRMDLLSQAWTPRRRRILRLGNAATNPNLRRRVWLLPARRRPCLPDRVLVAAAAGAWALRATRHRPARSGPSGREDAAAARQALALVADAAVARRVRRAARSAVRRRRGVRRCDDGRSRAG